MASLNSNLKELSKNIKLTNKHIQERNTSITKFIREKLDKKFEDKRIGSYAIKTTVKQKDNQYDIDMALIFHHSSNDETISQKQKVYDCLKLYEERIKDNPDVDFKEYAVTIDFESSDSDNKYHFDYTIYNKDEYVVKGLQHTKKELEESGNIEFVNQIKNLDDDSKEHFNVVTRLLKHCVKNGKFKESWKIPSIALTSLTKEFVVSNWEGSDDFLETITEIFEQLKSSIDNFKLPFEPRDNPFDRFSEDQNNVTKNKLEEIIDVLEEADSETDDIKKWELIKDFFPNLEEPDKGSGSGEKSSIKRTTSSQGA